MARTPETVRLKEAFSDQEKHVLEKDGAVVYALTGTTIPAQEAARREKRKPSFWYVVEAGDRLLLPSRKIEVAIFPAPDRFFVPLSFGQNTDIQERLAAKDGQILRLRLKLPRITQIIPDEAATLTELTFQHLDKTGNWLLGPEHATAQGRSWIYGRTKNPTNEIGSRVANVGSARSNEGLAVDGWYSNEGREDVGALRLIVPLMN